jgi:hypothetical protein
VGNVKLAAHPDKLKGFFRAVKSRLIENDMAKAENQA